MGVSTAILCSGGWTFFGTVARPLAWLSRLRPRRAVTASEEAERQEENMHQPQADHGSPLLSAPFFDLRQRNGRDFVCRSILHLAVSMPKTQRRSGGRIAPTLLAR
jgi:hypothetical protein